VVLDKTYTFDLDTTTTAPAFGADFHYKINVDEYISPQNGAEFYYWGLNEPSLVDCDLAPRTTGDILITAPNSIGVYICFYTDIGSLGYMKIDSFPPGAMTFYYLIWENP